ncbi:uncharacterized protein Bfra_001489 [Botrytis fragariae]|uniref:Uncharacterized protein n=1 Tax=Botrytis fragariae TaxID=1964551 RepID=A0A8H6ELX2_9HELO|nr:uncharacterized protein Bfra_001489 [Botrytis fragariae]KAF5877126.1 hypothetical protein Bfra_001489 [Botrytis fragariae]
MGILKHAVDFASDAAGLEKTLRLIQALCQICAFYPAVLGWVLLGLGIGMGRGGEGGVDGKVQVQVVEKLWKARRELAVGRRYMRFFRFIKNFSKAWDSLLNEDGMRMLINVGKSGFMGAYLGLPATQLPTQYFPYQPLRREQDQRRHLDIMGVCDTPWSSTCALEGNKFWFYSLSISIFGGLWDLYHLLVNSNTTTKSNPSDSSHDSDLATKPIDKTHVIAEHPGKNNKKGKFKTEIFLKIIENAADLFQPGAGTGWIVSDRGIVGVMTVISTVLSSRDIWRRVGGREGKREGENGEKLERRDILNLLAIHQTINPVTTAATAAILQDGRRPYRYCAFIKEKVTRDGDDQGEVTEELFESELKVIRKRLRLKKPEDTPLEYEIRTANSICAYFWHENGIKKAFELFPDAFESRSRSKAPEAKIEKVERPVVASPPPSTSTTMIAGIPLLDWLVLKKEDPETAKELMECWKAEQAEKRAVALAEKEAEESETKKEAGEAEAKANKEAEEAKAKSKSTSKSNSTAKEEGSDTNVDVSRLVDNRATSAYAPGGAWRNRLQPSQDNRGSKSQGSNQKNKGPNPQDQDEKVSKQVELTLPLRSEMHPMMYVAVNSQPGQVSKMFVGPKGEYVHELENYFKINIVKDWRKNGKFSTKLKNRPETRTALEFLNILLKDPEQVPQDGPLKEFLQKTKRI